MVAWEDEEPGTSRADRSIKPEPAHRKKPRSARKASGKKKPRNRAEEEQPATAAPEDLGPTPQLVRISEINTEDKRFQMRFDTNRGYLSESIEQHGQSRPIDLWPLGSFYIVIDGFGRLEVARSLGKDSIVALVHHGMSEQEALALSWMRNGDRKNLSPMEKANAIRRALSAGVPKADLPGMFGISMRQVNRYFNLYKLPKPIQEVFDGDVVTMRHVKALADFEVADPQKWRKRIATEKLSASKLRKVLAKENKGNVGRPNRFLSVEKDGEGLRGYDFQIRTNASQADLDTLGVAIERAREWHRRASRSRKRNGS